MPDLRQVPPGRAGALWLRHRLDTARRGVDLLDRKLRILRTEQERLRLRRDATAADWRARCADAELWLARAASLAGQRSVLLAVPAAPATVELTWDTVMGTRYPADATCQVPVTPGPGPGSAALDVAADRYRQALRAGVAHAAADAACRTVDAEIDETRRRLRGLQQHWVPRLERALSDLTRRLDEDERAEAVRLRWADRWADRSGAGEGTP